MHYLTADSIYAHAHHAQQAPRRDQAALHNGTRTRTALHRRPGPGRRSNSRRRHRRLVLSDTLFFFAF